MIRKAVFAAALLLTPLQEVRAEETPEQMVERVSGEMIETLKTTKVESETAIKRIVDRQLAPVIDFSFMAKRIMGKHAKSVSGAQERLFRERLKESLVNSYSKPLLESDSREFARTLSFTVGKTKYKGSDQATVSSRINADGRRYSVVYSMSRRGNSWKVVNFIVEGINIGVTFRNQFDRLASENQGDYDKVLEAWKTVEAR